ncbi:MAG: transcriptional regulator, partial [Cellulomonadaceae bacterium]
MTPQGNVATGARLDGDGRSPLRRVVRESWQRSMGYALDRDRDPDLVDMTDDDLRSYRAAHPLAGALPMIQQLLLRHTVDSGLVVAVGDQAGRLLWVDGDRDLRRRAEAMSCVEGADWSARAVGSCAPGTAVAV